jgi:hypothetical protein
MQHQDCRHFLNFFEQKLAKLFFSNRVTTYKITLENNDRGPYLKLLFVWKKKADKNSKVLRYDTVEAVVALQLKGS